ncbi:TonB family protein [Flammeovirgaceae bacterium 311]|nr:TonB family protein [Flammeovirgaceae bacterium 311]
MNKILLTIIILLSCIQLVSAQVEHLENEKKGVTIRLNCGPKVSSLPPLYVLKYKQQEYIIDSTEIKRLNPNDIIDLDVLTGDAAVEKYGDNGNNGVILIQVSKATIKSFLRKEELH